MKLKQHVKLKSKYCIITMLLMFSISVIQAQTHGVSGTVTDETNSPLPGVSVIVKGTNNGTTTNFDGIYEIKANANDVLVFSYIGFKTKDVIASNSKLDVSLVSDVSALDEVVIVGYGTQARKEVTGAVVNVTSEVIDRQPTSDLGTALQGQVAGVNVQASSGRPGEAANVQIRGLGSISAGGLGPLYVVDGIPYQGNPNIAPEQVATIDILKDGAAASIYGTRASNGVILITTKKGKEGKMQIDFSTYGGIQNITSGTPLLNTVDQFYEDKVMNDALGRESSILYFNPDALDYDSDFVGDVQNNNAGIQNFNLAISGGVKSLTLNFNSNYFKQEGVLINSDFSRFTNRITGEFKKGKFRAFATMGFTQENREQEPWALYEYAISQAPYQRPLNSNPSTGDGVVLPNANAILYSYLSSQLNNEDDREVNSSNMAINLDFEILEGFKIKANLGKNSYNYARTFFRPQYLVYGNDGNYNPTASTPQAQITQDYVWSGKETAEGMLTYKHSFGNHNLDVLGVLSYERFNNETLSVGAIFSEEANNEINNIGSGSEGVKPSGVEEESTISGKLLRIQYNYNQKYLFSASYRRDGSSKFSEANRYGNFFGASAGWNIHEENFFQNVESVNALKLRLSWAEVGNQNIPSYSFTPIIESGINYPFGPNEQLNFGAIQRRYVDPNIKWETTVSSNIGVDLAMFDNRLNITTDVYRNEKQDMLLQERLPASTGTYQPRANGVYDVKTINAGNMVNKGFEFAASWGDQTSFGLNYKISGTFTMNNNEVTDLNGIERGFANGRPVVSRGENVDYTTYLAEGYEAGAFFLVQHDGVIKTQEQLDIYKEIDGGAQLGDMMYIDQNGDNVIDDNDRVYAGSGQPDFESGLNFNFDYKAWDLYVQTYYSQGAEIYNGSKLYAYQAGRHADLYYMWSPQNADSDIPTFRQNAYHNNVRARSDYFLEDGSYFRIRNISLGFSLDKVIELTNVEKLRLYATAVNPFTFTDYSGYDPEVGGDGIFTRGVDRGNYPVTRQFMLGLQLSF